MKKNALNSTGSRPRRKADANRSDTRLGHSDKNSSAKKSRHPEPLAHPLDDEGLDVALDTPGPLSSRQFLPPPPAGTVEGNDDGLDAASPANSAYEDLLAKLVLPSKITSGEGQDTPVAESYASPPSVDYGSPFAHEDESLSDDRTLVTENPLLAEEMETAAREGRLSRKDDFATPVAATAPVTPVTPSSFPLPTAQAAYVPDTPFKPNPSLFDSGSPYGSNAPYGMGAPNAAISPYASIPPFASVPPLTNQPATMGSLPVVAPMQAPAYAYPSYGSAALKKPKTKIIYYIIGTVLTIAAAVLIFFAFQMVFPDSSTTETEAPTKAPIVKPVPPVVPARVSPLPSPPREPEPAAAKVPVIEEIPPAREAAPSPAPVEVKHRPAKAKKPSAAPKSSQPSISKPSTSSVKKPKASGWSDPFAN